jgi:transcriptional regulator with XRE-family HTH domain
MVNIDKLNKLATQDESWLQEANQRQENRGWLKHSQKIAVKVLRTIREKGIKQKELALMLGVSPQQVNKIVKGKENLTIETIFKLENALGVSLIFTNSKSVVIKNETVLEKKTVIWPVYTNTMIVAEKKVTYHTKKTELIIQKEPQLCENYG